jgi:MEDS: MEthanogen/methylotroph, DcmR Sensory domain
VFAFVPDVTTPLITLIVGVVVSSHGDSLFARVELHDHLVQFYDDDEILANTAGQFLVTGWRRGEALVTVATARHNQSILKYLDAHGVDARDPARARFFDAHEMLESISVNGQPDWTRFDQNVGAAARDLQAGCGSVRAFGEMVGLLWSGGRLPAALRVEELWTRALATCPLSLFCAYPIDVLARRFDGSAVSAILRCHTHLLPFGEDGNLAGALERAMDEVLGIGAKRLRKLVSSYFRPSWAAVPDAEAMLLWIRSNLPHYQDQILELARRYYRPDCAAGTAIQ